MDSNTWFLTFLGFILLAQALLFFPAMAFFRNSKNNDFKFHDRVTGELNFAGFEQCLEDELRRGGRYHYPVSLCYLDIDDFGLLNIEFGRKRADEILREFCQVVKSNSRCADCLGHSERDEFWILLPHTDAVRSEKFLTRLQHDVEKKMKLTFSAGVVSFRAGETHAQLLIRARLALQQAKEMGNGAIHVRASEIPAPVPV